MEIFSFRNMKCDAEPYQVNMVDIPALIFVAWPKITLLTMMCGTVHLLDAESTYLSQQR
jgi:hypothetical protein